MRTNKKILTEKAKDRGVAVLNLSNALNSAKDGDYQEARRLVLLAAEQLIQAERPDLDDDQKKQVQQQINSVICALDPKFESKWIRDEYAHTIKSRKRRKLHQAERAEKKEDSKIRGNSRSESIPPSRAAAIYGVVTGTRGSQREGIRALAKGWEAPANGNRKKPKRVEPMKVETISSMVKRGKKRLARPGFNNS